MNSGDIDVLTDLFQSRYGLIVGTARRFAPMPDLIFDVVQHVFIDFVQGAAQGRWDLERDVSPLLYRLTKNRALKLWRKHRRDLPEAMQTLAERLTTAQQKTPLEATIEREEIQNLLRCMEKLPGKSRDLLKRHYFDGVSMEEIARTLDKAAPAVRMAFHRIRNTLLDCLERSRD